MVLSQPRTHAVAARNRKAGRLLSACGIALWLALQSGTAAAQVDEPTSPLDLPRPGFEYDGIDIGSFKLKPELRLAFDYNSNVFLTSQNAQDDLRVHIDPAVSLARDIGSGRLTAEAHASLRRHLDTKSEDSNAYGASLNFGMSAIKAENFRATIGASRNIERRADPEARAGPADPPRLINAMLAEAEYSRAIGKIRLTIGVGAEKYNQLAAADDDRDMTTSRASVTVGYRMASTLDVFVEGYVNRRDFRLALDFRGIDRDQNTYGAIFGFKREIGSRIHGNIGLGFFRTAPEAANPIVPPYTGFRIDTEFTWLPRDRTSINFRLSRGDVATVRSGASTRVDTVGRILIDQEIRHNLLGQLSVSYVDLFYIGESRGHLKNVASSARLEYLADRRTSVFTSFTYEQRFARDAIEDYRVATLAIGLMRRF